MFALEPILFTDMELQTAVCAALTVCFILWMHTPLGHIITETCACIDLRYKSAMAIIDPVQKIQRTAAETGNVVLRICMHMLP
jgi:hypothetical protein